MDHTFSNFEFMQGFVHPYSTKEVHSQLPRATTASSYPASNTYLNSGEEPIDLADFLAISSGNSVSVKQELYQSQPPTLTDSSLQYNQQSFGVSPRQVILSGRMDQLNLAQGVETVVEQVFVTDSQQQESGSAPGKMPRARPSQVMVGKKLIDKNTEEYRRRRERNNVAVRRSRDKTRHKREETERRVTELEEENQKLREKLTLLNKEINVLKSLFSSVGVPTSSSSSNTTEL